MYAKNLSMDPFATALFAKNIFSVHLYNIKILVTCNSSLHTLKMLVYYIWFWVAVQH